MREGNRLIAAIAVLLTGLALLAAFRVLSLKTPSEAERRVVSERRLLATIVDTPSVLMAVVDGDGNVMYANARFREVFDADADPRSALRNPALRGVDALLMFVESDKERAAEIDLEVVRPGEQIRMLHFSLSRQSVSDAGKCTIMVGYDETLRHQARRAAAQVAKLVTLGEVTTGIAHELSQPLNVIRMAAQNALAEIETDEDEHADAGDAPAMPDPEFRAFVATKLHRIVAQVDRAAVIISRMRIFSRASRQGPEPFDVRDACRGAIAQVEQQFRSAAISIQECLGEEPLMMVGHQTLIEQVIVSLLTNACDVLREAATGNRIVEIGASHTTPGKISVRIHDNGPGVPIAVRDRVFEPFFTTKANAQGLGLATSFGIVRDIGGALFLVDDGAGASFCIDLPAAPVSQTATLGGATETGP